MEKKEGISKQKAKGGFARAKALTKEERSLSAKKAAEARWGKELPVATHQGYIESLKLACYVLNDGKETRVLSRISFLQAMGW